MGNPWAFFAVIGVVTVLTMWGVIYNVRKIFDDCPWRHDLLGTSEAFDGSYYAARERAESAYRKDLAALARCSERVEAYAKEKALQRGEIPHVDVFMYWRIDRAGKPTVSICDDPMSHPHAHLVRITIPEDVQKCILATKNPPLCLIIGKHGEPTGPCP